MMTEKKVSIRYTSNSTELETESLTEDEEKKARELFEDGIRDPGYIRKKIGLD